MKRLTIAVMCLLMCFSTVMPTTALAKCAHKKTQRHTFTKQLGRLFTQNTFTRQAKKVLKQLTQSTKEHTFVNTEHIM